MPDSPAGRVFVTGGGGFVGSRLLPRLAGARPVAALVRSPTRLPRGVEVVAGDLLRPESYAPALADCEVVVHLAAVTGRARPESYHRVNVEGTRRLLDACRDRGVERILFVSTIAAKWPRDLPYPYAESKAAAEELVRASGLRYRIVRPTMVFGPGSPVLEGLTRMARLPLTPLLDGGGARVQPIHVDDLCERLCQIVDESAFGGDTLELGGAEILSLGDLLERIGRARGRAVRTLRLPGAPVLRALAALERLTGPRLPVTAGQLSAFLHDGVAEGDRRAPRPRRPLRGVAEMIGGEAS